MICDDKLLPLLTSTEEGVRLVGKKFLTISDFILNIERNSIKLKQLRVVLNLYYVNISKLVLVHTKDQSLLSMLGRFKINKFEIYESFETNCFTCVIEERVMF